MTQRTIPVSVIKTAQTDKGLRYTEEELCRRFDRGMEEVRAGHGIVKSLEELKAIEARIAAEP